MTLMFAFIEKTWNPMKGKCPHECIYCYAMKLAKRFNMSKYLHKQLYLEPNELRKRFKPGEMVFVQTMGDLFAEAVPHYIIEGVFDTIKKFPHTNFLLMTKNPKRYVDLLSNNEIPINCILGVTIESDRNEPNYGKAPPRNVRIYWMDELANIMEARMEVRKDLEGIQSPGAFSYPLFLSVEPIIDFNLEDFKFMIKRWNLAGVAVGYENHHNHLVEPSEVKTMALIKYLEDQGLNVTRKTIREAWNKK